MRHAHDSASPLGDRFSLDAVIDGLASDLAELRAGKISLDDARARADLAKQIFNGVRLVITGRKMLEREAKMIGAGEG